MNATAMNVRVLLADDDALMRAGSPSSSTTPPEST
jgi:hypothetical protein